MSCPHSLVALISNTQFAKDGPAMRRSQQAFQKFQVDSVQHMSQLVIDTSTNALNTTLGKVTVQPQRDAPRLDQGDLAKVIDRGPLLDPIRGLLREYAIYSYDHTDVYNAIISLFGTRTFGPDALPSDALAFVTMAAYIISIVDHVGLNTNAPKEIREKATVVASIVSLNDEFLMKKEQDILQNSAQTWRGTYDMLLIGKDRVSTFVTDLIWLVMGMQAVLPEDTLITCSDKFMWYVAKSKAVPLSSAEVLSITARGEIVVNGNTYKASGYCREGVILTKVRDGVDHGGNMLTFEELFSRVVECYNEKSESSVCAGCSLQKVTENGRLYKYENSLCSADLTTAQNVKVHTDGSVDFVAETLLIDKRTEKVIRTGLRPHKCDLYDMYMLCGLDLRHGMKLSCLFQVPEAKISCDVECNGVSVWATVERMDDYELEESGRVKYIRHGRETKFANQDGECLRWGTAADGATFTIDDVIE